MDATSANNVLNATTKTIVDLLWGEVQDGEWAIAVGRMDNAMHAAHAVIQHTDVIPGILIAVEQLLHPGREAQMDDESTVGAVGSRMTATPTPAPPSTPPGTPIPITTSFACRFIYAGTPINTQPPANPQDRPNTASSSMGIMLRIPPSQATPATTIRMESAPMTSAVKAPINMGLIAGTAYSFGGNPLVSHEEHRAALQRLETVEVENRELCGLITRALDCIEVLEQGMASLGRICEATRRSVATSPTDFNRADMGFPFEQECSTVASHQELGPAQPSHSPSPSLSSNTIGIPSAINLGMHWHIGPTIVRSTTPILPSASPWMSSDTRRS
ncbi:hypothetical protein PAXRUDRAFT_17575 [Paxillus rubicundulus Ve08.2h10]|uniref:Uncharacterized protein n=1 Tax=Paxillus rubicundulus Ve08.2h10 TaxID=930991 RepID=A0A0D0CPT5_9AGAM|nr:hypothetical protein PAXRUDRAFT_17575 [Paxillus rubicundulus Ve08.2h10]